uniref:Uncharacterized protein n=1 Tax=Rhizophora mucronata TaxID=61149 RepID=A0A2P2PCT3_RHIMU
MRDRRFVDDTVPVQGTLDVSLYPLMN